MYRETRVHVIVPAYNVADRIGAVLKAIPDFVDAITVVDDASRDGTVEAVLAVSDRRLRVVRHEANQGVGGAMVTGFRDALLDGDGIVVKMDGTAGLVARYSQPQPFYERKLLDYLKAWKGL